LPKPVDWSIVAVHGELSTDEAVSVEDRLFSRDPSLHVSKYWDTQYSNMQYKLIKVPTLIHSF